MLIRHGESEGNARGIFQGHAEYPLSERGHAEARTVAARLAREESTVSALFTSPLGRAHQTAQAIATSGGNGIQLDDRLKEIDIGEGAGLTPAEIRERFPLWGRPGEPRGLLRGQESNADFSARILDVVSDLLKMEGTVIAVSHGGFISNLCRQVVGAGSEQLRLFRVRNCSVTEVLAGRRDGMVLNRFNDGNHLHGI